MMPMRATFISRCCARAASGHATVPPPITLMKSRRRNCLPKAQDYAHDGLITSAFYDRRNGVSELVCTASIG
jgi:uncharacterized protein YchJ